MFKNYCIVAWRNLSKNKIASFINIGGLSIGMAVTILIGLWIWDELNYDHYHTNYNRVAQVQQFETWNNQTETGPALPFPLGNELKTAYGDNFKYIRMASLQGDHMLSTKNTAELILMGSVASIIAIPVAYYYLHEWLEKYNYRVAVSWWVFAAAILGMIVITLSTISFQAIKAAMANPVKSLRSE